MAPRDVPPLDALRRFEAEDGTELFDLPDAPLPDPDTPAPVRFLPTWDAALLVHARRTQILPEEHRPKIFNTKMPQSVGHVPRRRRRQGRVAAERRDRAVRAVDPAQRREVEAEAARLAEFSA